MIVASDTLTCCDIKEGDIDLKPLLYMSKTFYLPSFKSIFAGTALPEFTLSFFNYITVNTFGDDIDSIINTDLFAFRQTWESNNSRNGSDNSVNHKSETIYLFGFSINENRFKGLKLECNKNEEFKW